MALHPEPKKGAVGEQIMISLFAYGDAPSTSLQRMTKVIRVVHQALINIDKRIKKGDVAVLHGD